MLSPCPPWGIRAPSGAGIVESSGTAVCSLDQPKGGRWGMMVAGPSQASPASSAWEGTARPACPWAPGRGRLLQCSQGLCQCGALPRWVDMPAATGGEAGWRAPRPHLQLGARTRVTPAGQGAGESAQTPEPPAWVCRHRSGCKSQLPQLPCWHRALQPCRQDAHLGLSNSDALHHSQHMAAVGGS